MSNMRHIGTQCGSLLTSSVLNLFETKWSNEGKTELERAKTRASPLLSRLRRGKCMVDLSIEVASRHFPIGVEHDLKGPQKVRKIQELVRQPAPCVPERSESRTFSILRESQPRQANVDSSDDPTFSDMFVRGFINHSKLRGCNERSPANFSVHADQRATRTDDKFRFELVETE
jgi:hypothetical protein